MREPYLLSHRQSAPLILLLIFWGLLSGTGMLILMRYAGEPSSNASAPSDLPLDVRLYYTRENPTLLLFIHPHCPCSNATLSELEGLRMQFRSAVSINVIFLHPQAMPKNWHQTSLWRRSQGIPDARLIDDFGCTLTVQFGVKTSGQVLFYDKSGRLLFCGGITQARGHAGNNFGSDTLIELTSSKSKHDITSVNRCSVFGCSLFATNLSDSSEAARP